MEYPKKNANQLEEADEMLSHAAFSIERFICYLRSQLGTENPLILDLAEYKETILRIHKIYKKESCLNSNGVGSPYAKGSALVEMPSAEKFMSCRTKQTRCEKSGQSSVQTTLGGISTLPSQTRGEFSGQTRASDYSSGIDSTTLHGYQTVGSTMKRGCPEACRCKPCNCPAPCACGQANSKEFAPSSAASAAGWQTCANSANHAHFKGRGQLDGLDSNDTLCTQVTRRAGMEATTTVLTQVTRR
ncbi:unnamed protein product, partial [Mesorhabditis spiculigera]